MAQNPVKNKPRIELMKSGQCVASNSGGKRNFECVMCKQSFKNHDLLKTHFIDHSKHLDIRGRPMAESTLLKHPVTSPALNKISCEFCPEVFPNLSRAMHHRFRKHRTEGSNHFCEFCGKLFPIRVALDLHKKTDHKKEIAQKSTISDSSSQSPAITGKPNEVQLQAESKVKQELLNCSFCTAKFVTQEALKFHEKCIHRLDSIILLPVPPPSTKIKMNTASEIVSVYYCYLCGSEYIMKYNLRKHLHDHHTVEERNIVPQDGLIRCKTCEAVFFSTKAYEAHTVHHKPGDLYVTSEEQRRKVVARVDQDFDFRRIPQSVSKFIPSASRKRKRCANSAAVKNEKNIKIETKSDDESMSPPSIESSSDDEIDIKPNLST